MKPELLNQGVELLVYGMGTVILFLSLLVLATRFMSWIVLRFLPDAIDTQSAALSTRSTVASGARTDPRLLAAIAAAVQLHRAGHSSESKRVAD